jgi:trimeric autotransporter adhesin
MKTLKLNLLNTTLCSIMLMLINSCFSQSQTYTIGGSHTFTVPADVYQIRVQAWGAGGKGGSCDNNTGRNKSGGGGGGGAFVSKIINVTPGAIYNVRVGRGATTNSTPGGDSWFINTSTVLAKGGNSVPLSDPSPGATGGQTSSSIGDIKYSGGTGTTGWYISSSSSQSGGGGSSASYGDPGTTGSGVFGGVAPCGGGNGGNGKDSENEDGNPGISPGGGGSGSKRNTNNGVQVYQGGNGADGQIIISWSTSNPIPALSKGPGGVTSGLQLWLRADRLSGTTLPSDNTNVAVWKTEGRGTDATKPSGNRAPKFKNNTVSNINFNPVVDFNNDNNNPSQNFNDNNPNREYLKGSSGFFSNEMYVVMMPNSTVSSATNGMDVFCGDIVPCQEIDKSGIGLGNYTSRISNTVIAYGVGTNSKYGIALSGSETFSQVGILNARNNAAQTRMELYSNAQNIANSETNIANFRNVQDSQYWIGRSEAWDGSLNGRVAEIITFSNRKDDTSERLRIESYLGIKYGVTLGINGVAQNYLNAQNELIWNAAANNGFNFNIAGIGRDDASNLRQKQSRSCNPNSLITVGLRDIKDTNSENTNEFDNNNSYLIWGDNGGNMNDSGQDIVYNIGPDIVTTITDMPNKKWKFVSNNNEIGAVKITIASSNFSGLPSLGIRDEYVMIVANDENFTTGVDMIFMRANGSQLECSYNLKGVKYVTFGVARETVTKRHMSFDGNNDVIKTENANNLTGSFSIMTWIRPTGQNSLSNNRTILSKHNGSTGYRIVLLPNNRINVEWTGGTALTSNTALPNNIWHNIAVVYNSGTLSMYIDGILDNTISSGIPTSNSNSFSIGGEWRTSSDISNHFKGDIDEVRIWNKALTVTELRFLMNQEMLQNSTVTRGIELPTTITKNDANALLWNNLIAYFSMNSYIGSYLNDDTNSKNRMNLSDTTVYEVKYQTAPMPYLSAANGVWSAKSTWLNGDIMDVPNSLSIVDNATPIDWNIVNTSHNIQSTGNKTLLGLNVNSNILKASNDSKIEVSHYLKINGKIDLEGKSQLIQTTNSDLDPTSTGALERDQQGQSNRFNYNYWSSPVSTINSTTINHGYTVAGVMKDGTNPENIQNITWTTGLNSAATSPVTLSSYWIFKFQNFNNNYANWMSVGQNGTLLAGQGFTLKGSNSPSSNQNYTFLGKPNNGNIVSIVSPNNLNLCGNPYPSAIDANKFIDDNASTLNGTIYFWEHYSTNSSHATIRYQGGYATYTKTGGTPPMAPAGISGLGSSSKNPKRFIPVGQGFFVTGSNTGGPITFNNSQRLFVKEENSNSFNLFRVHQENNITNNSDYNNNEDAFDSTPFKKVRLGFRSADNYHRQILLGFMNQYATSGYDQGYDAISIESPPSDMYFKNGSLNLNIQGDGYFSPVGIYSLGVKNEISGTVSFILDGKENFDDNQDFFIHDNVTNIYHNIKSQIFQINLPAGVYENRFSLRFSSGNALNNNDFESVSGITIAHSQSNDILNINNQSTDTIIKNIVLYNTIGQKIKSWNAENVTQSNMEIPVSGIGTGAYIVKVITDKGTISKKILLK